MHFNNELYILTDVSSKYNNAVHQDILGHICLLDWFTPERFGWFKAKFDDGWHRICTSIVKQVSVSDDGLNAELKTENSVYTFKKLTEEDISAEPRKKDD